MLSLNRQNCDQKWSNERINVGLREWLNWEMGNNILAMSQWNFLYIKSVQNRYYWILDTVKIVPRGQKKRTHIWHMPAVYIISLIFASQTWQKWELLATHKHNFRFRQKYLCKYTIHIHIIKYYWNEKLVRCDKNSI